MNFTFDLNKALDSALQAAQSGQVAIWVIFGLVALALSPWLIPAISKAIAEHRALSHKRELSLKKIRNSTADRKRLPGEKR